MDEGEGDNPSFPEIRGFPVRFGIFFVLRETGGRTMKTCAIIRL